MTLHIDQVETQMEVLGDSGGGEAARGDFSVSDAVLRERMRPIVLEILEEEIQRLRREAG